MLKLHRLYWENSSSIYAKKPPLKKSNGHFTAASDLFLAYTSTFENLGSNMILLKSLDDAGEVIVAIEDVKKIGNVSAPIVYEIIVISFINVKTTTNFEVNSSD
ncbi:hypothetical protein Tco_0061477 [Tanacetum coccineum]